MSCTVLFVCVAVAVVSVHGLYSPGDDVVELTPSNFHKSVVDSDDLWFVEFYAPWCGHCKSLAPEWKKAASALKGVVKLGVVNADDHRGLGGQYGVQGFPTIKVFGENKFKPTDFQGARSAQSIVDSALSTLQSLVRSRLSGKKSGGGSGGGSKSSGGGSGSGDSNDVVELTDGNFQKTVLESDDLWLVEFYAPWCGHCKNLAPHWAKAATELKGKVKLGALDATVHTVMSNRYGVQGFPTIKMFSGGEATEYDGGRTSGDIVRWAMDKLAENIPPPEVKQITDKSVLQEACDDHQLCIVSVLPHILDCQSKCRKDYLATLTRLGEKYKKQMWGWVWAEAGQQLELESTLDIGGFGYPALAAVNSRKMKFSLMRGSFGETGINEFLRDLSYGKGSTSPLKNAKLPEIAKVEAWDGKDGVLEVEEDIDLSDVDLDDLDKDEL
ncbi:protein disulfide-isomerase A6 [Aplysia californica]|uniref:protein disulfide-isomerase n=1 Tax=Aplysia californica TaxID=6500 RepID=A0ABM0K510_APLCA|nr:protein disulfide-isomerase A6 [Aplysia californica]